MCTLSSPAVGTRTVQTPGTVVLPKSKHDVAVSCIKQCYTTGVGVLASETEIMTAGNVVFGGVIGLGIDAASGDMNKYQPGVEVVMSPIPNCGGPKKGRGVPMAGSPVPQQRPPG
jgi:L-aminopeptidase/D-esterase-like protein